MSSEATKFSGLEDLIRLRFDLFSIPERNMLMARFTFDSPVLAQFPHSDALMTPSEAAVEVAVVAAEEAVVAAGYGLAHNLF